MKPANMENEPAYYLSASPTLKEVNDTPQQEARSPSRLRLILAATLGNIPLIGKLFDLSDKQAQDYKDTHDGKIPYMLRPWGSEGTVFGNGRVREVLSYLTLGAIPLNNRLASQYQEQKGSLPYFLRPFFCSFGCVIIDRKQ